MRNLRFALFALALTAAACSKGGKKSGPAVAEGGGITVTASELKARLDEQSPFIRARYATLDRKKEFLENLIRFELLAKEAEKKGLDKDPEVQATLKKIMVQKLVRQAFEEGDNQASESDAKRYYDDHQDEFVKAERVRVSIIWLDAPAGSAQRAEKVAEAKKLLAKLKLDEAKNPLAFGTIARDVSTDMATKAAGGDVGYRTQDELSRQYSKELAAASFALKDVGQETPVIETPLGVAIVKLMARQAALSKSFDEVKSQLVARVGREKRTKEFDGYVKGLREKAGIKINEAELEKVAVNAPAVPQEQTTAPGAMPVQLQAAPHGTPMQPSAK
jgi:peptidyl-prolyl cis-trans isomerase C